LPELRLPDSLTGKDRPRPREGVSTEVLDGEAVVYLNGTRRLHVLNFSASLIWQHLDGAVSLDELAALLSGAANVPVEVIREDVLKAVREFGRMGLLHDVAAVDAVDEGADAVVLGDDLRFLPEPPHG
jgi:hypothetical protein